MRSFTENGLEFDLNWTGYTIIKSENNGIGEYGVRQLAKCRWHNLNQIDLGNTGIIKMAIKLEILAASG